MRPARPAKTACAQLCAAILLAAPVIAADRGAVESAARAAADRYLSERAELEGATGISIAVSLGPDSEPILVAAGKTSRAVDATPMTPETLFQIGSITKSMAAVVLLQLQSEGAIDLDDPLSKWLPEYPAWGDVSLRRLLNMTSGIPGYDDTAANQRDLARRGIGRAYSPEVLVGFVDPSYPDAPAPTSGYAYSNTNYVLAGLVAAKADGRPLAEAIAERVIDRAGLTDMHYVSGVYPPAILDRMASGYFEMAKMESLAALVGQDTKAQNLSWSDAAGAAVGSPRDVAAYARALFGPELLAPEAQAEMRSVVSMRTGSPIDALGADDPAGFGLGVAGVLEPGYGTKWIYEGETLGYRVVYGYLPERDVIAVVAINSAPDFAEDQASAMMTELLRFAVK